MKIPQLQRPLLALVLACLVGCGSADSVLETSSAGASEAPAARHVESAHYRITSTVDPASTQDAERALEALFAAYGEFFPRPATAEAPASLRVRLYRDRSELRANSRSRAWAEAYYVDGVCHAYLDSAKPNPYHWLLHEAVHQLNREFTGYAKDRWINEGLATYFGSSRYADGRLALGVPDPDTYPLWWLDRWELSGDWATDVQTHRVIPLRTLITGEGEPRLDAAVNAHYLGWWSLTHFLLHHEGGKHAAGYRQLIEHGGSLEAFEAAVGPLEEVEAAWYAYFQGLVAGSGDGGRTAPNPGR